MCLLMYYYSINRTLLWLINIQLPFDLLKWQTYKQKYLVSILDEVGSKWFTGGKIALEHLELSFG